MKEGKYVGGRTPFGYVKAPDDCHQLIPDPTAAVVVQKIFQWASEGAGLNTIVLRLNKEGCITPSYYKQSQGTITHENLLGNGKWQTRTVNKILRSPVYTGDLVQGRSKTVDHKQIPADEDEWTTVCGTHEAIISHELYDRVQQILESTAELHKNRTVHPYTPNILKGKIFCSECGGSLHRQKKCFQVRNKEAVINAKPSGFRADAGVFVSSALCVSIIVKKLQLRLPDKYRTV